MPAIITTPFRITNAAKLIGSALDDNSLYLTVGKSDDWPTSDTVIATPTDCSKVLEEAKSNIIAMKQVASAVHVVPRINWVTSSAFKEWDPSDSTSFVSSSSPQALLPCYCVHLSRVYKCVAAKKNVTTGLISPSTVAPTHSAVGVITEADGYSWAYIGTVLAEFDTRDFIGVSSALVGAATAATGGRIYGYRVVAGGTGYTDGSTVTITGDGTTLATATVTTASGIIRAVNVTGLGAGYTRATVSVGTGTGAIIEPLIAPRLGHGYNPPEDLAAYYVGCSVELDGNENVDLPTDNDYRQIGLILNPLNQSNTAVVPDSGYVSGLKTLSVPGPVTVPVDYILYQPSTGAKAFVDTCNGTVVRYHQNYSSEVNFIAFTNALVSVYPVGSPGSAVSIGVATVAASEYKHGTGDMIFLENRRKVTRADSQSEQIKVVIQF